MDEKIKTWPLCFPAKKTLIWRRHCSISQSCCSMTSKRSTGWFLESFSRERSLNQPKATRVCIRSINQSNRSISVRLLFLFCSSVFISRSYENRCNIKEKSCTVCLSCKIIKCKIQNSFACVQTPLFLWCPFSTCNEGIDHFRVPKTLTFKIRPSAQPFLWKWVFGMRMITHLHIKGWVLNLALVQTHGWTRKWSSRRHLHVG